MQSPVIQQDRSLKFQVRRRTAVTEYRPASLHTLLNHGVETGIISFVFAQVEDRPGKRSQRVRMRLTLFVLANSRDFLVKTHCCIPFAAGPQGHHNPLAGFENNRVVGTQSSFRTGG